MSRTAYGVVILISCMLVTLSSYACRCFHRHYLYSLFYSEQVDKRGSVECNDKIRPEEVQDSQTISLISYPPLHRGHQSSTYGEVYSSPLECRLLIGNQVISEPYTALNDKRKCDREIIEACKALKSKPGPKWPASKPVSSTYIEF